MARQEGPFSTELVDLDSIDVEDRLRPLAPAHVDRLAASIQAIGLQTPISVRWDALPHGDGRYVLVAGAHRLAALRKLGETDARAFVSYDRDPDAAALWEIEENFARRELSDAQRADHHARREAILVRKGAVAAPGKGGDRRSNDRLAVGPAYAEQAATSLGINRRTVERDLRRGKEIAPEVLREVQNTPLDRGVVLDELAATPREVQPERLAEIRLRRSEPRPTAAVAAKAPSPSPAPPTAPPPEPAEDGSLLLRDVMAALLSAERDVAISDGEAHKFAIRNRDEAVEACKDHRAESVADLGLKVAILARFCGPGAVAHAVGEDAQRFWTAAVHIVDSTGNGVAS